MSGAPFAKKSVVEGDAAPDAEDLWQYQFAELFENDAQGTVDHGPEANETQRGSDDFVKSGDDSTCAAAIEHEADQHLRVLEKARRDALEMREALTPSAFGLFIDLDRQLDDHARAQLRGPGRYLVHVSDPAESDETARSVPGAVDTLLQTYALPRADDTARAWTSMATFATGRKAGIHHPILDTVSSLFSLNRVVAVYEAEPDVALREMSDVRLELRPVNAVALGAALAHGFRPTGDDSSQSTNDDIDRASRFYDAVPQELLDLAAAAADRLATSFDLSRLAPSQIDFACSKALTVGEAEALLSRALSARADGVGVSDRLSSPTLDELPGYEAVRPWAEALARDIRDYGAGRLHWSEVDVGALLAGPPGTGKTMLAGAIARSAGCAFVATSFAEWLAHDGGHLGSVAAAMRKTFAEATQKRPCVLFIDELDSLPARGVSGRHDDYWRPLVNALLELLDGDRRREGLVVLAACNDSSRIDPALLRSGRLDRTVTVDMPTVRDLSEIFHQTIPELEEAEADRLAAALVGSTTGADVARLAREARGRARREGRPVVRGDILAIALPPDTRSFVVRRRVAIHEAGHAIGFMLAGRMPLTISIDAGHQVGAGGWLSVPRQYGSEGRRLEMELAELVPLLCGRAAEDILLGEASSGAGGPASSDLARATQLAAMMIGRFGLGASLVYTDDVDRHAVDAIVARTYAQAQMLMLSYRASVIRLSDWLLQEQILTATQLQSFGVAEGLQPRSRPDD